MPGAATSEAEVTNISRHGFWVLLDGRELFLPFDEFPWFKRAPVEAILRVERPQPGHLYWHGPRCRPLGRLDRAPGALPAQGQDLRAASFAARAGGVRRARWFAVRARC